jgi:hypothetical protein
MRPRNAGIVSALLADPFGENSQKMVRGPFQLLGARFRFESNSDYLLRLVDSAYADLPRHRLSAAPPTLRVGLILRANNPARHRNRAAPPAMSMLSGAGYLSGATDSSNFVVISPAERAALVVISQSMLKFPYHTRYEFIEFAVFTLAARSQSLTSLHAACIGEEGRGILLMGSSGSGKSTVTLHCLLQGMEILSEDSVYVEPKTMLATGVGNFLHLRPDSLRWLGRTRAAAVIRKSPVIQRRSGVEKLEVDLRQGGYRLAASALKLAAIVFLSPENSGSGPLLNPLSKTDALKKLAAVQAYAANQPGWAVFGRNASRIGAFELRRGRHPLETVEALQSILRS